MNVFVLNTGRCGSTTFDKACQHITNYTSAHESRTRLLGADRFAYPPNHIEVDNRLSWLFGRLENAYGDHAIYIHLKRNENETAKSYVGRYMDGIMMAYRGNGILLKLPPLTEPMLVAMDYVHTVNSNIEYFLKDKTQKMVINLEGINTDFPKFWDFIQAEGDLSAALAEFNNFYHATKLPELNQKKKLIPRIGSKVRRLIVKFPRYIRNA